jgi:hypothetical protein
MVNGLFTKPGRGIIPRVNFPDNLYRKYTGNIPEIYRKYTGNIPEIYRKYTGNIPEIYRKYTGNIPKSKLSELLDL